MIIKSLTINTHVGARLTALDSLPPAFATKHMKLNNKIQLNLTCIMSAIVATSYSDSLKLISEMIIKCLTINTQVGGKINRPGQLAANKFMPLKCRSDIIISLNDCRRILNSCCLAEK